MKAQNLQILADASRQFLYTFVLEPLVCSAMDIFEKHIPSVSGVEIHLLGANGKSLYQKAHRGLPKSMPEDGLLQIGEKLPGRVAQQGKALCIDDLKADHTLPTAILAKTQWTSYEGYPLFFNDQLIGVLGLYFVGQRAKDAETGQLTSALCDALAAALHNSLQHEQAAARARRFISLSRAITATRQLGTQDEVLEDLAKVLVQSFGFDLAWIGLIDEEQQGLVGRVGYGHKIKKLNISNRLSLSEDKGHPAIDAISSQKPVIYPIIEPLAHKRFQNLITDAGIQSFGYLPIISEDKAIGALGVFYMADQPFDDEDVKTLTSVAEQAAVAIENALLYERIHRSEENYRTLFHSAGSGLVILDEDLSIKRGNHAFAHLLAGEAGEVQFEGPFQKLLCQNGDNDADWGRRLKAAPQSFEAGFYGINQPARQVHFNTTRLPSTGEILVSMIDMTRERELERRLFRSEELASIGELSAGIAHEIRNPLVAITTSAALLKDEPELSEEGQELIDVIKDESDHLAVIVDDFLRFARPQKPRLRDENINKLLEELIRRTAEISPKSVALEAEYGEGMPMIAVDRHQIQQVVTNLLLNGIDASEQGSQIHIRTQQETGLDGPRIRIEISDHGEGIPADEITKIFQPFFSTKERGTGLGLAICRRIIDNHEGEISVESVPGEGACFSVFLPVRCEHQIQTN